MQNDELLQLNKRGLIPGPGESEEDFQKRAAYCLEAGQHLAVEIDKELYTYPPYLRDQVQPVTQKLFDIDPDWVPVMFSNHQLAPWHGGCAWIVQVNHNEPVTAFLQLRKQFSNASVYLGIYSRSELVAHELAHVGRMAFEEPQYEEFFAYQTSHSAFRRWFGPLVQSARETLWLMASFFIYMLALLFLDQYGLWVALLPLGYLGFLLGRLTLRHRCFNACLRNLMRCGLDENRANQVMYRLQDHEINLFAGSSPEAIQAYCCQKISQELRWQLIYKNYFSWDLPSSCLQQSSSL